MISEFNKVRIKQRDILGEVIDIYTNAKGETFYTVEAEEKGVPGGRGDEDSWKLFECREEELEKLK